MLATISKMGIKEIEGGGTYGLPMDEYKQLLAKNNLKMISIAADFNKLQTDLPAIINEAKAFGAKYVTCFWIPHKGDEFTMDDVNKAISVFYTAGKTLKKMASVSVTIRMGTNSGLMSKAPCLIIL
jgi:sugar phosphate isomerase/epimerase